MRSRGPRLGELLERDGVLTRELLLRALRNQKVVGGKLGTCLLEIDALPEEALVRGLAGQQGADATAPEDLRGIADEVLALVPAKLARAHFVVPFRATNTQIEVAMIDARDLKALDELAFVTGRRVRPHVASEVRILEALEKFYGVECPSRFVKILDRLNRSRFLWRSHEEAPRREQLQWDPALGVREGQAGLQPIPLDELPLLVPPVPQAVPETTQAVPETTQAVPETTQPIARTEAPPDRPTRKPGRRSKGVSTVEIPAAASAPPVPPRPTPPPPARTPPATFDALAMARAAKGAAGPIDPATAEKRLLDPATADDVGRVLIDFAASRTAACVLFQVRRVEAAGWMGHGVDDDEVRRLRVRLDRPSLFVALREGSAFHRGPLPDLPAHAPLRETFGELADREVLALPLRVRGRFVGALVALPTGASFGGPEFAELQLVVALGAHALELCVLRQKLRKS